MNLTDHQQWVIKEWAKGKPNVDEIRLFGSRAKGNGGRDSDIDLAITLNSDNPGGLRAVYYALSPEWQDELTRLLEAKTHIALYNDPDESPVRVSCDV